jgi:hypothetical protein
MRLTRRKCGQYRHPPLNSQPPFTQLPCRQYISNRHETVTRGRPHGKNTQEIGLVVFIYLFVVHLATLSVFLFARQDETIQLVRRPLESLLHHPQMTEWSLLSSWWNENWQEKLKYSEKTCPGANLSTTTPTRSDLGPNLDRRGRKPSYGMAQGFQRLRP